jgi:hypothetical protein
MMRTWILKVNPSTWCVTWTASFFVLCPWGSSHASWTDKPAMAVKLKSKNSQKILPTILNISPSLFHAVHKQKLLRSGKTFFSFISRQPLVGLDLLIVEVSRSHSKTPHSIGPFWKTVRPVAGKRASTAPRLRPRGHRHWPWENAWLNYSLLVCVVVFINWN